MFVKDMITMIACRLCVLVIFSVTSVLGMIPNGIPNLAHLAGQQDRIAEVEREMREVMDEMQNGLDENDLFGDFFKEMEEAPASFFLGYAVKDREAEQGALEDFKDASLFEYEFYRDAHIKVATGIYGKDLLYAAFFLLKWEIDQKLHQKFDEYYLKGIFSNFSAQKKQLISLVSSGETLSDEEGIRALLCEKALEIFSVKKELNLKMYTHLFIHWLALMGTQVLEEGMLPSEYEKPLLVSWIDHLCYAEKRNRELRQEHGLSRWRNDDDDLLAVAAVDDQLPTFRISPTASLLWFVQKYIYGFSSISSISDWATAIRPRALDFAKACYPPTHAYHKILNVCDTATSHKAFTVLKELYLWTRSIKKLHELYKSNCQKYFAKNSGILLTLVLEIAAAEELNNNESIKKAENKLIDFVKEGHCVTFKEWFQCKASSMAWANLGIESILLIPGFVEAAKQFIPGFVRAAKYLYGDIE